jgi:hypothetical protein
MAKTSDKPATLIMNCAVLGRSTRKIRKFEVCDPKPYAQYATSVVILFTEPKKRNSKYFTVVPDNLRFFQIEQKGEIVYDSRNDVPLNPEVFMESYQKNKAQWQRHMEEEVAWAKADGDAPAVSMSNFSDEIVL